MRERDRLDHENTAIDRLTQLGTGATALLVGARQILSAIDVHPADLLHTPRAEAARDSARETLGNIEINKRFQRVRGSAADRVEQVAKSKRLRHTRDSVVDAVQDARSRAVSLSTSDAARSTGKLVGVLGAQAIKSKSTRRAARRAGPLLLRRSLFVVGIGSVIAVVAGRMVLRSVRNSHREGTGKKKLSSGERNAELARLSNEVELEVDALMPSTQRQPNL